MKLKIVSDLHLEFGGEVIIPKDDADVLILSGDICTAHNCMKFKPFFDKIQDTFEDIIYVMGNHEHYHGDITESYNQLKELVTPRSDGHGLHILENDGCRIGDYNFFGATFWTDMDNNSPYAKIEAQKGMNDYRLIKNGKKLLTVADSIKLHSESISSLEVFLDKYEEDFIVVGHHLPSAKSLDPRYKGDELNPAYYSNLEDFILENPKIRLWTHGHTHSSSDYMVGLTRIVANPAGYPLKGRDGKLYRENINFNINKVIEI